ILYEKKFRQACKTADKIIAISKQTADDIINMLDADPAKIEIVYQGCDKIFYKQPTLEQMQFVKEKYNLPSRFIVNVGTIETRKNLVNVVKALAELPKDINLIALGRATPYIKEVNNAIRELGLQERVKLIHNASFTDFPAIYKQAIALTYVSLFEGFGIPVLEGLTIGTPVITSNLSSMPEAGGDAALYANPHNPKEIASHINMLISSPTIVKSIIEKGKMHAEKFKEKEVVKNVREIYASLLK
ncbi:MAG: glycosyltransferase family 1 protein, partial [Bacteroidales bacterium]